MKIKVKYENLQTTERKLAEDTIDKISEAVAHRLPNMEPDLQRLEGHVRKAPKGHRYGVSLRLHLPSATLVVHGEQTDFAALLAEARNDLVRRVRRHLARLQHYQEWRRKARRDRFAEFMATGKDEQLRRRRELFFDVIEEHLDLLWNYAWRELAYLEANGDLPVGALSLQDAVDTILVAGVNRFERRPSEFSVTDWLYQLCVETLESEARRIARAMPSDVLPIDEDAPEPATDPTEADQEFYEFYQPDDAPTLESLVPLPDEGSAQESYAEHETARALHRALACLPTFWRHAIVLVHLEDLPEERVVEIMGVSPEELTGILADARRLLKAKLADFSDESEKDSNAELLAAFRATATARPSEGSREMIAARFLPKTTEDKSLISTR